MKKKSKPMFLLLTLAVIAFFLVKGIASSRETEEALSIKKIQEQQGVPVDIETVHQGYIATSRTFYGSIRSANQTLITSKLMERIDKIEVSQGDKVSKDQVLVVFDTRANTTSLNQLKLALEDAQSDVKRIEALFKEGAVSQQDLDKVRLNLNVTRENYETAASIVEVTAPISGTIARIDVNVGDVVNPGQTLMTIVDENNFEVEFDITPEDRRLISNGQNVSVKINDDEIYPGNINRISYAANDDSRLFHIYASIDKAKNLYPGIFATIEVIIEENSNAVIVSNDALISRNNQDYVVVVDNNTARLIPVKIGIESREVSECLTGVNPGDKVAVNGHIALEDGSKVKVIEHIGEHTASL